MDWFGRFFEYVKMAGGIIVGLVFLYVILSGRFRENIPENNVPDIFYVLLYFFTNAFFILCCIALVWDAYKKIKSDGYDR